LIPLAIPPPDALPPTNRPDSQVLPFSLPQSRLLSLFRRFLDNPPCSISAIQPLSPLSFFLFSLFPSVPSVFFPPTPRPYCLRWTITALNYAPVLSKFEYFSLVFDVFFSLLSPFLVNARQGLCPPDPLPFGSRPWLLVTRIRSSVLIVLLQNFPCVFSFSRLFSPFADVFLLLSRFFSR